MLQILSQPPRLRDPLKHTIPILDQFVVSADDDWGIIVMPLLSKLDDVPLGSVSEVVDCVRQALQVCSMEHALHRSDSHLSQGLVFLHKNGVAYGFVQSFILAIVVLIY